MITRNIPLNYSPDVFNEKEYDLNRIAFFDIETTGFAADSTYLYLIGCAYYQDSTFHIVQWFSEDIRDEILLLTAFFEFIENYNILINYNGTGFDLPYLLKKCALLELDYNFDHLINLDIYKKIYPYKKIFQLNNLKQKSVETFLNIDRKDIFSGGDLIQVYQSYLGKKHYETLKKHRTPDELFESESEILLHQLLLHNEDDIKGLIGIFPILNYIDVFEKSIRILQADVKNDLLSIQFEVSAFLPVSISYSNEIAQLTATGNKASLSVHIFQGELKYFYENYKDYYYLPAEDYAIHKSLADFVDKEYRQKAKPSNCYTKKNAIFAPQYEMIFTPCFKNKVHDKLSFVEIHTDFLLQEHVLEKYVTHILSQMIRK